MDPSGLEKPRPRSLSSSVSMFIEDSRVTAVANADVNPRYPGCFYSVSAYTHSPNVGFQQSPIQTPNQSWNFQQKVTNLGSKDCGNLDEQDDFKFSSSSGSLGDRPTRISPRPREIIHKIIQEASNDDEEYDSRPSPTPIHVQTSQSSSRRSSSNVPSNSSDRYVTFSESCNTKPQPQQRFRSATLNIEPVGPFVNGRDNIPVTSFRDNRTYTSVNLTLRSPSAGSESKGFCPSTSASLNVNRMPEPSAGPPLCACGGIGGGNVSRLPGNSNNTMTYSTYSNSRDGFEAQVQIQIGPNGGTISASRRRKENMVLQKMNADLVSAQAERKEKLMTSLNAEKNVLAQLQQEIAHLRSKLFPLFDDFEQLKDDNQRLRVECQLMTREVDLYDNGTVLLGETSEEFYSDIYPGQDVNALFGSTQNRRRHGGFESGGSYSIPNKPPPPPRPPPPKHLPLPPRGDGPKGEWFCSMCTFQNHPELAQCEACGMVRVTRTPVSSGNTLWQ